MARTASTATEGEDLMDHRPGPSHDGDRVLDMRYEDGSWDTFVHASPTAICIIGRSAAGQPPGLDPDLADGSDGYAFMVCHTGPFAWVRVLGGMV